MQDVQHASKNGPIIKLGGNEQIFKKAALYLFKWLRYVNSKFSDSCHSRTYQTKPTQFGNKIGPSYRIGGNKLKFQISTFM